MKKHEHVVESVEKGSIAAELGIEPGDRLLSVNGQEIEADMSKFLALIIDSLNHDVTIGAVLNPTDKIHALLDRYKNR